MVDQLVVSGAVGDMKKSVYDTDNNGRADEAELARGLRETTGPTSLPMGAVADGQVLKRVGATIVGAALVSSTLVAQGPTTVLNETETVLTTTTLVDGEALALLIAARGTTAGSIIMGETSAPIGAGLAQYNIRKTAVAGQHEVRLRHDFGVSITFDWKLIKVS